jgi:hypothetical protein
VRFRPPGPPHSSMATFAADGVTRFSLGFLAQAIGTTGNPSRAITSTSPDSEYVWAPLADDVQYEQAVVVTHPRIQRPARAGNRSVFLIPSNRTATALSTYLQQQTSTLDYVYPQMWEDQPNLALIYCAFDEAGLMRLFPGVDAKVLRADYDPTVRGWYIGTKAAGKLIHTDPYIDAFRQGWMISIAAPIRNFGFHGMSDPVVGVASVDVTVKQIAEQILKVTFFG